MSSQEAAICPSCEVCEYCGLEIEEEGQKCAARDDARCQPVPEGSSKEYCSQCGSKLKTWGDNS